jgi:hypothetical protein
LPQGHSAALADLLFEVDPHRLFGKHLNFRPNNSFTSVVFILIAHVVSFYLVEIQKISGSGRTVEHINSGSLRNSSEEIRSPGD